MANLEQVIEHAFEHRAQGFSNRAEVEAAIRLTKEYPEIILAVNVGNETQVYWSAHRCPFDELLVHVRHVRARVDVPVTVADDYNYWNKEESRAIASEIDFITMHAHPMWNGLQLEDALEWLAERLEEVQSVHPESHIVIGETGPECPPEEAIRAEAREKIMRQKANQEVEKVLRQFRDEAFVEIRLPGHEDKS